MSQPESIGDVIETRRRSRSKTPMMNLRVSSDRENGESSPAGNRKVRKTPTVEAIDESDEQPSSQKSLAAAGGQPRSTAMRKTRIVTSDYSSDDVSPDRVQKALAVVQKIQKSGQLSQSAVTTTTTQVTRTFESKTVLVQGQGVDQQENVVSVKTSSAGNSSADKESTVAKQATTESPKKATSSPSKPTPLTGGTKQQEEVVSVATSKKTSTTVGASKATVAGGAGRICTSTPKNAQTFKAATAKIVLTPEELQQHAAYKEYLEAGEYWNKYPKTDYTYSELSPHRREVAPGLVAMPNMSRPSLNKHAERVQTMIERNPTQEAFIRQRYTSARSSGMFVPSDPYDSTEEVDSYLRQGNQRHQRQTIVNQQQSIVSRFFLSIVTFFFTCFDSVRSVFRRRDEEYQYYTRIEDERGFFARAYSLVSSFFINVFKRIYLLISSVLFLDAWLLQTSARNVEQQQAGQRKRRFLLFLLVLLPFLLIGAYLLADGKETIVLPASSRATLALSSLSRILPSGIDRSMEWDGIKSFYRSVANVTAIPVWMESVRSLVPSWSWWWWPRSGGTNDHESFRSTLQRTLSAEEYDALMRHIDVYIDGLMEQKYASRVEAVEREQERMKASPTTGSLAPELTVHVANVIEKSLKQYNYHLTDADVDLVAEKVRLVLEATHPLLFTRQSEKIVEQQEKDAGGKVVLSKEYLTEIQRLVEQQITVHNNHYVITGSQLEELLTRILSSDRLLALIDARATVNGERMVKEFQATASVVDQQRRDALVDDLRKELNDIKAHFSEQLLSSSVQWEARLEALKANQGQLGDQLRAYRLEHNELYQKLLADIDGRLTALRQERYEGVNSAVREHIITILGLNVKQDIGDGDLRAWISGLFVARDDLERRLEEIQAKVGMDVREEIERTAGRLMKEIGEKMREEMLLRLDEVRKEVSDTKSTATDAVESKSTGAEEGGTDSRKSSSTLTEDDVKRIVRDALTVYDADKTGMVDYALESAGGQVLSTRCTENYQASSAEFRIFGIPIWYPSNTPRTVISPTMEPGQCWAFQGFPGYLVIQLNTEIIVTGFTLEHISKLLVANGSISSAPKHFTVWGLQELNDPDPILLGSYEYLDKLGSSVQYFPVQNKDWSQPLQIVELRIETNHGNIRYTCLYRFRVHGEKV
ncbi:klaroid protein [Anopheles ziemanni]|uniref:klaroid protein n=1 Tax=Anopheles ziemanni TaxID=345580 RepID=UPI002659AE87|nr:klaroid protein isoform X2 [Anopheles coustani]XP_058168526.1 klaroid protein [Anopheles ziemanni]